MHFKQLLSRIHRKYGCKNFHFNIRETKKHTDHVYVRMHLYKDKKGLKGVSIISNYISYVLRDYKYAYTYTHTHK